MILTVAAIGLVYVGILKIFAPQMWAAHENNNLIGVMQAPASERDAHLIATLGLGVSMIGAIIVWNVIMWGAYRQLNGLSRRRSAAAFVLYTLLAIPAYAVIFATIKAIRL
jgi:hypothetical protein